MCEKKKRARANCTKETMSFEALTVSRFIKFCVFAASNMNISSHSKWCELDTYYLAISCHNMQIIFVDFRFYISSWKFKSFVSMCFVFIVMVALFAAGFFFVCSSVVNAAWNDGVYLLVIVEMCADVIRKCFFLRAIHTDAIFINMILQSNPGNQWAKCETHRQQWQKEKREKKKKLWASSSQMTAIIEGEQQHPNQLMCVRL